ncbi:Hypothetical predicted protein, partial [Marmota monax]
MVAPSPKPEGRARQAEGYRASTASSMARGLSLPRRRATLRVSAPSGQLPLSCRYPAPQ